MALIQSAKQYEANTFHRLRSIPGVGKILALVMLYEIHDIRRFPRVQDFVSYGRLVKCARESAGKRYGTSGTKLGNAYLKALLRPLEAACLVEYAWHPTPADCARTARAEWPS